ncbi:MAG: diguanylate cyclase [Ruminococcus sp.]|nr:diguanylate cyclase [Ruminococcus sp.]
MKQFAFKYSTPDAFENELGELKKQNIPQDRMLFYIYSEILEKEAISAVCGVIEKVFPDSDYIGCSTSGNIVDCELASDISVVCAVFEKESTRFMVRLYPTASETGDDTSESIIKDVEANPWIKAAEMYFTIPDGSFTRFCSGMDRLDKNIRLFGGVSCSDDITSNDCMVFAKNGGFTVHAVLAVFYGGEDFYVDDVKITGWKPLKRTFRVTSSQGSVLKELDGIPAYDVYSKYLGIENSDNFFYNTLEFPLFYEHNGTTILRVPVSSNPDGSIVMSSDIDTNSTVCLSYGDPQTVVDSITEESRSIRDFCPEVLHIFSCAARRAFWDRNKPTYELLPFKDISSSAGFFSHGEFIRTNGYLNQHNVTLVIAAMREGEPRRTVYSDKSASLSLSKIPLVSRLARFIAESTRELEEAVVTDGLTGLYNRKEIQLRIENQLKNVNKYEFSIIMLDIDNFKKVNDTYGHQTGDTVIRSISDILRKDNGSGGFSGGRWGGEEFMLLLPNTNLPAAADVAESIRRAFEETKYPDIPSQTVSVGVTQARCDDTIDSLCTRVDSALYKAKQTGKNRVVKA